MRQFHKMVKHAQAIRLKSSERSFLLRSVSLIAALLNKYVSLTLLKCLNSTSNIFSLLHENL